MADPEHRERGSSWNFWNWWLFLLSCPTIQEKLQFFTVFSLFFWEGDLPFSCLFWIHHWEIQKHVRAGSVPISPHGTLLSLLHRSSRRKAYSPYDWRSSSRRTFFIKSSKEGRCIGQNIFSGLVGVSTRMLFISSIAFCSCRCFFSDSSVLHLPICELRAKIVEFQLSLKKLNFSAS